MNVGELIGVVGGASGIASAIAAAWSAKAASAASRPFVHAMRWEWGPDQRVSMHLKNSGPGVAIDVRCLVTGIDGGEWSGPFTSLAPGGEVKLATKKPEKLETDPEKWSDAKVAVTFTGIDGSTWKVTRRESGHSRLERLTPRLLFFWRQGSE